MEPIGSFQGLATGINFRDLVDQIIQAESRPITLLRNRTAEIDRKTTAWGDFQSRVQTLFDRSQDLSDGSLFNTYKTSVTGMSSGASAPLGVAAGTSASPGSFAATVNQLATREKVSGDTVSDRTAALGYAGEVLVGGRAMTVAATDSLDDVAALVNQANTGTSPSGVSAAVVAAAGGGYRLVLTAARTGSAGIDLRDGSGGVLASLGFQDGTTSVKHQTSDGAKSDTFVSSSTAVATLLGLSSPPASAAVDIGGVSVTVDLFADSLDDVASAINTAAGLASSGITAVVVSETDDDGATVKRLDISGTTSFTDANGILETLGVLQGGRGAVAQQVQGAAFTDGDGVTTATAGTLLTDLWGGGAAEGVQVGDTLTLSGSRGDGTTFAKTFTVAVGNTYQDLVDALNSASDAFGSGGRTATVSIEADGSLLVTDDTAGDSRLALSIVANNEGGGTLDFGDFSLAATGRARELTAGLDAEIEVDGVYFARSSNTVTDVVEGVTLTLKEASGEEVLIGVDRDVSGIVSGIEAFIKAFNAMAEYVSSQFTGAGAEDGQVKRPLSGDAIVRQMNSQLRAALEETISSAVTDLSRLSDMGITLNREGVYEIDKTVLTAAVESDPLSVQRYFAVYGAGSTGTLDYIGSVDATQSGAYAVEVTTLAEQAAVTGSGFGGTYVDDGTADTLTVTDAGTNSVYSVSLTNGMTLSDIVDALNTELQTATQRQLQATEAFKSDAVGTAATDATTLSSLYSSGGSSYGVADGDTLTISGTLEDGTSFYREWVITEVTTQTLGDLRAEVADAVGADVDLELSAGVLTATAIEEGRKTFTVAVSSDNAGGGSLTFGTFDAVEEGRGKASITASESGGELALGHDNYGASAGFDVAFTAGGADGSASLGVAAGSYRGVDVVGTIGGQAATGSGRLLTGDADTSAEGLIVSYTGASTGSVGTLRFSRGIAALMELTADSLLDTGDGGLKAVMDALDTQKQGIEDRIAQFEFRLNQRADFLIKRFSALEEAMAKAQQQAAWIQAQLGSLTNSQSR